MKPAKLLRVPCVSLALGLFVAACAQAPVGWRKDGGSTEQWDRDRSACRYQARKEAEKRFGERASEVGSEAYSTTHTLARDMAIMEARKEERRLFESCLKARGYSKQ